MRTRTRKLVLSAMDPAIACLVAAGLPAQAASSVQTLGATTTAQTAPGVETSPLQSATPKLVTINPGTGVITSVNRTGAAPASAEQGTMATTASDAAATANNCSNSRPCWVGTVP